MTTKTRIPKAGLKLLDEVASVAESPQQHIRNTLQSLILADERVQALTIPPDQMLAELIRNAEARCFRVLFALGKEGT